MQPRSHLYLQSCWYSVCLTLNTINNRHKTNYFFFSNPGQVIPTPFFFLFFFTFFFPLCMCMRPCPSNAKLRVTESYHHPLGPGWATICNTDELLLKRKCLKSARLLRWVRSAHWCQVKITQWGLWSCCFVVGGVCVCVHMHRSRHDSLKAMNSSSTYKAIWLTEKSSQKVR